MSEGARRIVANTAYRLLADLGSKLGSVAFFVVMARELGEARFGVFTFALAFVALVTSLGNFGQDSVLTREVARDRSLLDSYFANTLAIKVVVAGGALAAAVAVAAAAGMDSVTLKISILLGLGAVLELLTASCFAAYQAFERLEFIPLSLISQRLVTAAVGIAALAAGAGLVVVAAVYLLGAALGFFLAVWFLLRHIARPRLDVEPRSWRPLMRASLAIGLAGIFGVILFRVDTAMLAAFESNKVVGDYGAAYRLLETTLFVSWSVGAAVYPVFSRLGPSTEPPVGFVFERSIKLVVALTLPLAAGACVLADPLIRTLYGSSFDNADAALVLLAPAVAFYPISYLAGYLLISQRRQRLLTIVFALVALENVLGNLVLIPWLSLKGAALGTSLSELLVAVSLVVLAQRAVGRFERGRVLTSAVTASALATLVMWLLRDHLVVAVGTGAVVYLAVLVAIERALYPDDLRAVLELLPGRLLRRGGAAS